MKPINLNLERLLGFKIVGKCDASLSETNLVQAASIGSKIGPKPTVEQGSAVIGTKIGVKPGSPTR